MTEDERKQLEEIQKKTDNMHRALMEAPFGGGTPLVVRMHLAAEFIEGRKEKIDRNLDLAEKGSFLARCAMWVMITGVGLVVGWDTLKEYLRDWLNP